MSQSPKDIAERIIEFTENEELRQLWGTVGRYEQIDQLSIELAKAYLELEKENAAWKLKNDMLKWDNVQSEITKLEACVARLKEENEALQQGISDMERAYDNVKDGLSKNICGYCEQSMNSDQNPSYEQLVVANDFNQQEIAKLKEELERLKK